MKYVKSITKKNTVVLVIGFYWFSSDIWAIALFSVIGVVAYSTMMLWILSHAIRGKNNAKAS
jgi:hypothetical protein